MAEADLVETSRFVLAVSHAENLWIAPRRGFIDIRTILPRIALDGRHRTDVCRQSRRVQERLPRAREILYAQEHAKLLSGRRHQNRLRLALARLQRRSRIALLARQEQTLITHERL